MTPTRTKSETLVLREGRKYRTLVGQAGQLTKYGREYEDLVPDARLPRVGYDPSQAPSRTGDVEYIRVGGKERMVRRYDPATNDWRYSRLGKQFYGSRRIQYVV